MTNTEQHHSSTPSNYFQFERKEMVRFLPKQYSKVLEIGCAKGGFKNLLTKECECWGVEYDSEAAMVAKKKLHKVLIGNYDEVLDQLPDDYFDLVICNDVIEHMPDECAFLKSITSKMNNEATIVISLPNVRYIKNMYELLVKKDWRYRDAGILDRTHMRFFTKKSIKRTIESCGFKINQMQGINNAIRSKNKFIKIARYLLYKPIAVILGQDILFMQYGLSAQKINN